MCGSFLTGSLSGQNSRSKKERWEVEVMRTMSFLASCLVVMALAVPAMGQIDSFFDVFTVELGGDAQHWNELNLNGSGGSGWPTPPTGPPMGQWIPYDAVAADPGQTDPGGTVNPTPSWWNEWFYDGRYRPERYKVVDLKFDYRLLTPGAPGGANIVINWSTPEWSLDPTRPNEPPMTNEFVGRAWVGVAWLPQGTTDLVNFEGSFDLRQFGVPFNPEWVSIDVAGYNIAILNGQFNHRCIPEPGTAMLLMLGAVGVLMISRRA
jgi:hypothetical protein